MDEDLRRKLVAIDDELRRVPLPRGLQARVLATTATDRTPPARLVLVAAAAAAVLAFLLGRQTAPNPEPAAVPSHVEQASLAPPEPRPPEPQPPESQPRGNACPSTLATDDATHVPPGCTVALSSPEMTIAAHTPARLVRTDRGVRVLEGDAFFAVDPVEPGAPTVRVEVEGGTIEVLGTRFVVHQVNAAGHVDLLEGAIEFTAVDGKRRAVIPGRRLHWAEGSIIEDASVSAPATTNARTGDRDAAAEPATDLDAVLDEVARLRRRAEYRKAATLLRSTRASIRDASASEILSYEEGTLREHYQPPAATCAFWRAHVQRFGEDGRYASSVAERLSRLGCTE